MTPGRCKGKAHQLEHLGVAGRRVLVSRKWSNKTLDDHRAERTNFVRQLLHTAGIQPAQGNDMPHTALDIAVMTAEKFEQMLPDGTPEHFYVYGSLLQLAAITSVRTGDPWRARELLRGPARRAAQRIGEGKSYHHIFFGPTNLGIHRVSVEVEAGEIGEALRMADEVDIAKIAYSERRTAHLYQVARCYGCRNNDTTVLYVFGYRVGGHAEDPAGIAGRVF